MVQKLERRAINEALKVEKREEGGANVIQGYSALFGKKIDLYGMFTEEISPGAFKRALKEGDDCRCLFNHDPHYILGRSTAGSLKLKEDEKGLWMECEMPDTQVGRDVLYSIQRGDVTGQSFAAEITEEEWIFDQERKKLPHRVIRSVVLYDVGPVVYPAYEDTSIGTRSKAEDAYQKALKEWEATERTADTINIVISPEPFLLKVRSLRAALL